MTPSGIEPATSRFVTQRLNHCANAVPPKSGSHLKILGVGRITRSQFHTEDFIRRQRPNYCRHWTRRAVFVNPWFVNIGNEWNWCRMVPGASFVTRPSNVFRQLFVSIFKKDKYLKTYTPVK